MITVTYVLFTLLSASSVVLFYLTTRAQQWLGQPLKPRLYRIIAVILLIVSATILMETMGVFPALCTPFLVWMLAGMLISPFTTVIKTIFKK